ncbi:hypothetical protein KSS87_006350, partial [Heliosperma pusillum]
PIVYDENGKVIEDFDEVDVRKIEMSNVWETVVGAEEKKSMNKEIEDLLGCKAPQEIDILPLHKAKNKGSGKRHMSSKEKARICPLMMMNVKQTKKRMSSITDNNQISPLEEALDKANKKIKSFSIEILEALTNVEAAKAREEYMQKELDSLQAQIHFLEAEKDGMRRQLEEKQYTEADMDGQFVAGVKTLKKSYTRVNTSIPDNWSSVLEAM